MKAWMVCLLALSLGLSACAGGGGMQVATFTPQGAPTAAPTGETPTRAVVAPTTAATDTGLIRGALLLDELRMQDALNGWALGRVSGQPGALLLRTADSGYTWQSVTPPHAAGESADWYAWTSEDVWAVFSDLKNGLTVWRTQDGGTNWDGVRIDTGDLPLDGARVGTLTFSDRLNGWLLLHLPGEEGRDPVALFKTYDGGLSWNRLTDPTGDALPGVCAKTGVFFLTDLLGWVTGDCRAAIPGLYLFQSGDGGKSWAQIHLPDPPDPPGVFDEPANRCAALPPQFFNPQEGIMRVTCKITGGVGERSWVYRSTNGGRDWSAVALPSAGGNLEWIDLLHGWLISGPGDDGMHHIQVSEDGGQTWREQTPVSWDGRLDFITWTVGWGLARLDNAFALVKTTNGGQTWEQIPLRWVGP